MLISSAKEVSLNIKLNERKSSENLQNSFNKILEKCITKKILKYIRKNLSETPQKYLKKNLENLSLEKKSVKAVPEKKRS